MELADNEYFNSIMLRYFLILIEYGSYLTRQNRIYLSNLNDDKALGIYEAMKEIALEDNCVICLNFDPHFPVHKIDNLHFISTNTMYLSEVPCEFLFVYGTVEYEKIKKVCDYYNPKFIFHC